MRRESGLPDEVQKRLTRLEHIERVLERELGSNVMNVRNPLELAANLTCALRTRGTTKPTRGD